MAPTDLRPGRRYRVTLLQDRHAPQPDTPKHGPYIGERPGLGSPDRPVIVTPAGTVYQGYISAVDGEFFDLTLADGQTVGFYWDDPGIRLDAL
jgi:hypothetical protein